VLSTTLTPEQAKKVEEMLNGQSKPEVTAPTA
jgi:hypothetical protein